MDVEQRTALRQIESVPILSILKDKLHGWRDQLLPKHPMSQADRLHPQPVDTAERLRRRRLGPHRQQHLRTRDQTCGAQSQEQPLRGQRAAGHTAAILSSFTATAKRHGIDPQHYLTQLLTNLPRTPISQIDQWLPDVWKINQAKRTRLKVGLLNAHS